MSNPSKRKMTSPVKIDVTTKVKDYLSSTEGRDDIKSKARDFLNSTEGRDLVKSIAGNTGANIGSHVIQSEIKSVLSSYDGKQLVKSATTDINFTQKVREFLSTNEGTTLIRSVSNMDTGLESRLNDKVDSKVDSKIDSKLESKFNSFLLSHNFKTHILSIVQTQSYFEELCKQIFMENAIREKIGKIAPDAVQKEIKSQLREIIQDRFNSILVVELTKLVPQMVREHCNNVVPQIAKETAQTTAQTTAQSVAQSTVQSLTPSLVTKEMQSQFPTYVQNHPVVQSIMTEQTTNLTRQLNDTASMVLERVASDDNNNQFVKRCLEETDKRCNLEVANFQAAVNNQLQQNAAAFNLQLGQINDTFNNQMNINTNSMNQQLYTNHQTIQSQLAQSTETFRQIGLDMKSLSDTSEKINAGISKLQNRIKSLEEENEYVKSVLHGGMMVVFGITIWLGISWFKGAPTVMPNIQVI